jgi:hypothetical protein
VANINVSTLTSVRLQDTVRTAAIIDEAKAHKRYRPDPYLPSDESRTLYFVVDDEYVDLDVGIRHDIDFTASVQVSPEDALALTADTGMFG